MKIPPNFKALTHILGLLLLVSAAFFCSACDDGECTHQNTKNITYEPDCSRQGFVLRECRDCGYSYKSDFVEPYGHTLSFEVTPPTCTEQGYTTYLCSMCGYTYDTDFIAPFGHELTATVTAPTCSESGYTVYTCASDCGFTFVADAVAPTGHTLNETKIAATCTEGGYSEYKCEHCDFSYTSAVSSPLGHEFTDLTVRPSIARTGYTTHQCHCGYSYTDQYVWYSDIFTGAAAESDEVLAIGLDISYHDKNIDWEKLKATGIDYVILRAAYGVDHPDTKFEEYYAAAKAVGLDVGCYFYTYATKVSTVEREANYLLELLEGKTFEYPIYFDLEDPSQTSLDEETLMEMTLAFCEIMAENGYFPAVYTNHNWLVNYWKTEQLLTLYDVWYARYPKDDGVKTFTYENWTYTPSYAGEYGMWQFTEYGRIDGIEGDVDLNMCYKDYPSHIKKYGYNGFVAE